MLTLLMRSISDTSLNKYFRYSKRYQKTAHNFSNILQVDPMVAAVLCAFTCSDVKLNSLFLFNSFTLTLNKISMIRTTYIAICVNLAVESIAGLWLETLYWLSLLRVRRTVWLTSCVSLNINCVLSDHQGLIDAPESVQGMLQVIASLTEKQNGSFLDNEGQTLPW